VLDASAVQPTGAQTIVEIEPAERDAPWSLKVSAVPRDLEGRYGVERVAT